MCCWSKPARIFSKCGRRSWGINRYFADAGVRVPLQVQVTLDTSGRMLFGTDIASALTTLEALPIDVIGLNCSTGPEHMASRSNT